VNAADLKPFNAENAICKFCRWHLHHNRSSAINTRTWELDNIETWALNNNLKLNRTKTMKLVCVDIRRKRQVSLPPPVPGITRVVSLKLLGVIYNFQSSYLFRTLYNTLSAFVHKLSTPWKSSKHPAWLILCFS